MSASNPLTSRRLGVGLAAAVCWLAALPAHAESAHSSPVPERGLMAAQTCAGCHGTQGHVGDSAFVPLAGMPTERFIEAMRSFADGSRPSTLMGPLARAFTEQEIEWMADYFAAQPAPSPLNSSDREEDQS